MIAFNNAKLVLLPNPTPYTFFEYHFVNQRRLRKPKMKMNCTRTHSRDSKHTLDILLIETLKVVFWFNPCTFSTKAIQLNHEFYDEKVVYNVPTKP
jgi:hypothetical protein